jgi:hypothetical protein
VPVRLRSPLDARLVRALVVAVAATVPVVARAQAVLGPGDDATTPTRGRLRITIGNEWERYTEQYVGGATGAAQPLAAALQSDSLGPRQLPSLAPTEQALARLSGDASFRLTLGRSVAGANTNITRTPITAELGLLHRLALVVTLPIVRTRTVIFFNVNPTGAGGNVGANPARLGDATAVARAAEIYSQVRVADSTLAARLAECRGGSTAAYCAAILSDQAAVEALIVEARQFAQDFALVYGVGAAPGAFVPQEGSAAQQGIERHIGALRQSFSTYQVGGITDTVPVAATAAVGQRDLDRILTDSSLRIDLGAIRTVDRLWIGDLELGARLAFLNTLSSSERRAPRGFNVRSTLGALLRLGTGHAPAPDTLFAVPTGDGQTDVEMRSRTDVIFGRRLWANLDARYGWQLPDRRTLRIRDAPLDFLAPLYTRREVRRDLGDYFELGVTPRLVLSRYFAVGALYDFRRKYRDAYSGRFVVDTAVTGMAAPLTLDASTLGRDTGTEAHRVGVGFAFSTLAAYESGKVSWPFEVSYQHLETVAGRGGYLPKSSEDRVSVRVQTRLFWWR